MTFKVFNTPNYYVVELGNYEESSSPLTEPFKVDDFLISALDGFAITDNSLITEQTHISVLKAVSLDELANSHGEWIALAERKTDAENEYIFFGDRFGYSPIFYSTASDNYIVVSCSFHGVVLGLEKLGVPRTLNVSYYSSLIASNAPTFQNSHLNQTMSNEINLLPADFGILVRQNSVHLFDRDLLGNIKDIDSYDNAIALGVDYVCSMIEGISSSKELDARITLTGGVDSRLCASLAAKNNSILNYSVSTIDPRTWNGKRGQKSINRDMIISNRIRKEFNLSWWRMPNRRKVSIDFRESLAAFQSYRSNLAYTFIPNSVHSRFSDTVLTIRGGGGEILRVDTTIEKIAAEFESERLKNTAKRLDEGRWYATYILRGSLLVGRLRELAIEDIVAEFPYDYGESFLERVSKLYLDHRYRGHFGHQRQSTSANDIILHPLSNPYFLKAAKLLAFEKLSSGELVKKLFNETCPRMLDFTFASDEWSTILTGACGSESEYYSQEWVEDYDSTRTSSESTFDIGNGVGDRGEAHSFEPADASVDYLIFAFEELYSQVPNVYQSEIRELQKRSLGKVKSGQFIPGYMVAKVASALDCFYVSADTGNYHQLTCSIELMDGESPRIPSVDTQVLSVPQNGFSNLEVPIVRVDIRLIDSSLVVLVRNAVGISVSLEFAYYIYKDGTRISSKWYVNDPILVLPICDSFGTYFVEVFARLANSRQMVGKFRTESILVSESNL